jgi:hypothetical protein
VGKWFGDHEQAPLALNEVKGQWRQMELKQMKFADYRALAVLDETLSFNV